MAELFHIFYQLLIGFVPWMNRDVPFKTNFFQKLNLRWRHTRLKPLLKLSVNSPLSKHPMTKWWVLEECARNSSMTKLFHKGYQLFVLTFPWWGFLHWNPMKPNFIQKFNPIFCYGQWWITILKAFIFWSLNWNPFTEWWILDESKWNMRMTKFFHKGYQLFVPFIPRYAQKFPFKTNLVQKQNLIFGQAW